MLGQIIAFGGGGFSTKSEPGMDTYLLALCGTERPRIGFIGTASGDSETYKLRFYARFAQLPCTPSHLDLFHRTPDLEEWAFSQDLIFVGGGNTKSMLAVWREWRLDDVLQQAMEKGVILAGISAGAICWFESGVTDSLAGKLTALPCLGFLPGSCCPHYSGEKDRRPAYQQLVASGLMSAGIAIDDACAVHYIDGKPARIIKGSGDVTAYHVTATDGQVTEEAITSLEELVVV